MSKVKSLIIGLIVFFAIILIGSNVYASGFTSRALNENFVNLKSGTRGAYHMVRYSDVFGRTLLLS